MKIHTLIIVFALLSQTWAAGNKPVTLKEFDTSFQGFSFQKAKMIKAKGVLNTDIDFIIDFPLGIASNNAKIAKSFKGKGKVYDVSKLHIKSIKDIPIESFGKNDSQYTVKLKEIKVGKQYLFLCADGKSYALIRIIQLDKKKKTLTFSWELVK